MEYKNKNIDFFVLLLYKCILINLCKVYEMIVNNLVRVFLFSGFLFVQGLFAVEFSRVESDSQIALSEGVTYEMAMTQINNVLNATILVEENKIAKGSEVVGRKLAKHYDVVLTTLERLDHESLVQKICGLGARSKNTYLYLKKTYSNRTRSPSVQNIFVMMECICNYLITLEEKVNQNMVDHQEMDEEKFFDGQWR